jgi:ribosomal protein L22
MSPAPRKKKAEEVEEQVSEEAAKSVPRAEDTDDVAPAEESSEAAAVEASAEDDKPTRPAKRPRGRKGGRESGAAGAHDDKADEKPSRPTRRRDQPRAKRQPGEAAVVVRAQARYVRTSARKARLVCDHIRGKDVEQARAILSFTPRGAAKPWMKLLESAIANAEHNHELVGDELKIASVHADEGPTLKRYRPRAMGRATRIRKRTSHLTITLTPKE